MISKFLQLNFGCKKACLQPIPEGVTHRLFLPDDMQLCNNFLDILDKIIRTHPEKVICLFPFDRCRVWKYAYRQNTPYFNVHIMSCCGVVMPVQYIEDCFKWIDKNFPNQDAIIDDVAMQKDIETYGLYTYEEFEEYITYDVYQALSLSTLKVAVGKGMLTKDEMIVVIEYLLNRSLVE